jgi:hypothetical protein
MDFNKTKFLRENKEDLIHNFLEINSIAKAARKLCIDKNIEYTESFRAAASKIINGETISVDHDIDNETETNQYQSNLAVSVLSALKQDGTIMNIEEYCSNYNIPFEQVKTYKLVTHTGKGAYYNIASRDVAVSDLLGDEVSAEKSLSELISKLNLKSSPSYYKENLVLNTEFFDRLVFTDVHINLDPNGDGNPMYGGVYDRTEILRRLNEMVAYIRQEQVSSTLYIDELGDFMDGYKQATTRNSGHSLPQLTNDKDAFDLGVEFKVTLIKSLLPFYKKVICNNITNDNHSGDFSYFVNMAAKGILETLYPDQVEYNVINKFFHHYTVGQHTMVLSHGKDSKEMKHGMKPTLDASAKDKIDQYCKHHGLYNGNYIEFSKGDSHQAIFDESTSNDFSYYSYPAFSPPSAWVQTNFGLSRSGFRFFNINMDKNQKITHPYYFN